jgi:hypothetical protein
VYSSLSNVLEVLGSIVKIARFCNQLRLDSNVSIKVLLSLWEFKLDGFKKGAAL